MSAGPNLLCIGMQKAGTRWLYDALSLMPNTMMLPVKEFHHFDANAKNRLGDQRHVAQLRRAQKNNANILSKLDATKFNAALDRYLKAPNHDCYLELFTVAGSKITSDLTPAYSTLNEEDIKLVKAILPDAKIVLMVRNPVDRAWSHFNMYLRNVMRSRGIVQNQDLCDQIQSHATINALEELVRSQRFVMRSFPSHIYQKWRQSYNNILVLDFDDIVHKPDLALKNLQGYLFNGEAVPSTNQTIKNRKNYAPKAIIQPEHQILLKNYFQDEFKDFKYLFPEIAKKWLIFSK